MSAVAGMPFGRDKSRTVIPPSKYVAQRSENVESDKISIVIQYKTRALTKTDGYVNLL